MHIQQLRSAAEQLSLINSAIQNGADAIMLAAINPAAYAGIVEEAKAKGVKIIYLDSPADEPGITTLATDNYNAGVSAGNTMLYAFRERNIREGSIGIISVLPSNATTAAREKGFQDALEANGQFRLLPPLYIEGNRHWF